MKKLLIALGLSCVLLLTGCSADQSAQNGDVVNIDFVGKLNGEAFDGGTASQQAFFLGSGGFIDGFEDQIVGMKTGETKTITVTFPDNYTDYTGQVSQLAGKECTFDITMNKIYKEVK